MSNQICNQSDRNDDWQCENEIKPEWQKRAEICEQNNERRKSKEGEIKKTLIRIGRDEKEHIEMNGFTNTNTITTWFFRGIKSMKETLCVDNVCVVSFDYRQIVCFTRVQRQIDWLYHCVNITMIREFSCKD